MLSLSLPAQNRYESQQRAAERFLCRQTGVAHALQLKKEGVRTLLYAAPRSGFVLMDKQTSDILGYGDNISGDIPAPLRHILAHSSFNAAENDVTAAASNATDEQPYMPFLRKTPVVAPILKTKQHQSAPYNDFCPYWIPSDGTVSNVRCKVGCVATALAQIMISHGRIITVSDTLHGRSTAHFNAETVLPGGSIDPRIIRPEYEAEESDTSAHAAAQLAYWCGLAARMTWGRDESGASIQRLVEPLQRVFGYGYVHCVDSYQYTPENWMNMLIGEITSGRAVLYGGYLMQVGGHAFALDGLDGNGLFHVNWGYGGNYDGYFRLDVLNFADAVTDDTMPDDELLSMGFHCNQQAVLLWPDAIDVTLPDTLERTGTEIKVSNIRFEQRPHVGIYTPMTMDVENISSERLTTPFEFMTNLPTDTATFEQADYVGLTGVTLQPGEKRTLRVHLSFYDPGERIFHLSADDEHLFGDTTIFVNYYEAPAISISQPEWQQWDDSTAIFTTTFTNAEGAGRSGELVTVEVVPKDDAKAEGPRHFTYIYLQGGEQTERTVRFTHLQEGVPYTLLVRYPWEPARTLDFVLEKMPEGIANVANDGSDAETIYTIDGRQASNTSQRGIYIVKSRQGVRKIWKK